MQDGYVKSKIINKHAEIEFYHPKGNSLNSNLLKQLENEIKVFSTNTKINAIVISSKGENTFCSGASFDELLQIEDFYNAKEFFSGFGKVILAMKDVPQFIIGKVIGKAVGGGVGLISAFDYSFATKNSSVKLSELQIGIGPFVISPAVERKIGSSAFSEMTIDTNWKSSEWAKEKGLFNDVVKNVDELNSSIFQLFENIEKYSFDSVSEMKKIFWSGTEDWDELMKTRAELSSRLVLEESTKDFLNRFKNKKG